MNQQQYDAISCLRRVHTQLHTTITEADRGNTTKAKQDLAICISQLAQAIARL